jgi:Arc/MetJ family transcription regulator
MFSNRVKIDDELFARAKKCAELAGYSSTDEFIQHVLEKEITRILGSDSGGGDAPEEVKKRLQGLGYIE